MGALSVCLHRSASKYLSRLLVVYIYSKNLGFGNQMLDFQVSVTNTLNSLMITIHHHFTLCTDLLGTLRVSTRLLLLTSRISLFLVRLSLFCDASCPKLGLTRCRSYCLTPNTAVEYRLLVISTLRTAVDGTFCVCHTSSIIIRVVPMPGIQSKHY